MVQEPGGQKRHRDRQQQADAQGRCHQLDDDHQIDPRASGHFRPDRHAREFQRDGDRSAREIRAGRGAVPTREQPGLVSKMCRGSGLA